MELRVVGVRVDSLRVYECGIAGCGVRVESIRANKNISLSGCIRCPIKCPFITCFMAVFGADHFKILITFKFLDSDALSWLVGIVMI